MALTILQRTSAQSMSAGVWTAVSWSSAVSDSLAAWSSGSPTQVVVPAGVAFVDMTLFTAWASASGGYRRSRLVINGVVQEVATHIYNAESPWHHPSRRYAVTPGDVLKTEVQNGSGSALNFFTAGMTPTVQFRWWGS